ncbi:M3 family metallopeptidase, partial [Oceanobacillus massiliensis]|uniref:M3 family metallopeptidase n=1 Tax=Oceanobacillus massiliensis TaxID=1465765 RepID=UPI003018E5B8
LSEKEEALLAEASEPMSSAATTFGMLNNADLTFPAIKNENGEEVDVTHGRYSTFLESKDRRVREDAFKAVYDTYGKFKNTFASTLSGNVKTQNFSAKVRNYESARQAALDNNNIPEQVYDNLVEAVNEKLSLLHRYTKLRKKVLELDELHMYDLYTPLVKDVEMKVT